jgi:uncharacterized protein (DUF433 family)
MSTVVERAFTADRVLRLTGLTKRQLQYWEETGLIRPSYSRPDARGRGRPRLYDFRDLVELRTVAELRRHGISLQLVRKVRDYLRGLDYEKPLSVLSFDVLDGELYFAEAGTVRKGRRPEQTILHVTVPLPHIVAQLKEQVAALDVRMPGVIESRRGTLGGKAVIAGTRISVATVWRLIQSGMGSDEIRELYPDLTDEDIRAAAERAGAREPRSAAG